MSVLSAGTPFHAAALTITSIASNYLAVFPLRRYRPHSSRPGIISVSLGRCHAPSSPPRPPPPQEEEEELTCVQTSISGVITSFHGIFYLPSTLHLSPFIAAAATSAAAAHNTAVFPDKVALTFLRRRRRHCSNKKTN